MKAPVKFKYEVGQKVWIMAGPYKRTKPVQAVVKYRIYRYKDGGYFANYLENPGKESDPKSLDDIKVANDPPSCAISYELVYIDENGKLKYAKRNEDNIGATVSDLNGDEISKLKKQIAKLQKKLEEAEANQ